MEQKALGPEGRVLSQSSGMDCPVAFESPQLTEGCVTLGAHVGLEPRVGVTVNTEVPSVAEALSHCSQRKGFSWVWVLL